MNKINISIILPFPVTKPVGGAKVMYEYANRLHQSGHNVRIFHSIKRPFKRSSTPLLIKRAVFYLRNVSRPKWFKLDAGIGSSIVPEITDKNLPDADIIFSTWWQMTYAIDKLSVSKGKKFNLIQDYEIWAGHQDKVDASYSLKVNHLVIAKYLQKLVREKNGGIEPVHIPNAIDSEKFCMETAPDLRGPYTAIMLYSKEPRKNTVQGLEALELVHKQFPQFQVSLFGVYPPPVGLPDFCSYIQKPEDLRSLYNQSSVFFSPSNGEGWALPPGEAMACGCAVVCTDIGGHHDYAIHEKTALLVQPGNVADMAEKILYLLKNKERRLQIAMAGNLMITTKFSWDQSVKKLESCFYNALKN